MRKFLISAAVATAALTVAAPAAAQYAPPLYGSAYNFGQVRNLQVRIDRLQYQITNLDRRNILSNREAAKLMDDSRDLERRLQRSGRNGLNYREARAVEVRLARLEQRMVRDARDGNRWSNNWTDRDRDGRNDRYEDDRGYRHD